jgi:GT2 family glycosyltransferase
MYWEDCDLSLRLLDKGWILEVVRDVFASHAVAASSGGSHNTTAAYYSNRNRFLMWRKHDHRWISLRRLLVSASLAGLTKDLGQSSHVALAAFRGMLDGLRGRFGRRPQAHARDSRVARLLLFVASAPTRAVLKAFHSISALCAHGTVGA